MAQESLGNKIALGLVKTVVFAYDLITFPIYFFVQQPWEHWKKSSNVYAKLLDEDNPTTACVRLPTASNTTFHGFKTVDSMFRAAAKKYPDKDLFGMREVFGEEDEMQKDGKVFKKLILGDYKWMNFKEVERKVDLIGKGLLSLGVRPRQNVVILAETRLEWMMAAQACFRMNVPVVTLYATLGLEGIIHGINETEATHVITSQDLLPKLSKAIESMPSVNCIVYMESFKPPTSQFPKTVRVLPFSQMEKMGETADPALSGETPQPDDIAIIMYTSGSTGIPKGVMVTHLNIVTTATGFSTVCPDTRNMTYIAFLPLAHVLELAAESFFLSAGIPIGYSSPHTLTDKSTAIKKGCQGDASLLKPTVMASVPLILDRIRKTVEEVAGSKGPFSKSLFQFAIKYKQFWTKKGFETPLLNRLMFKKIQRLVGGRVQIIASGGAPLSPDTHEFIRACLGCKVIQGYGLTETAAGATIMSLDDPGSGTVGAPLNGCYIRLKDWEEGNYHVTDQPCPRGEILIGGDCVSNGYYKNEALTKESFWLEDNVRWFATGDIGELHDDGNIKIIDRKKDLVKLQFGEYISLGKVEAELKTCPLVENICVYGNSFQTYLVAIVAPSRKPLQALAERMGKGHMSFPELCRDRMVAEAVAKTLREHGIKSKLQRTEIPTKVKLCTEEWLPEGGLVTAAFKLRRKVIQDRYQLDIDEMYGELEAANSRSKST